MMNLSRLIPTRFERRLSDKAEAAIHRYACLESKANTGRQSDYNARKFREHESSYGWHAPSLQRKATYTGRPADN
jgi:hypothetical protein